ncbi:MAG: hypothetical protein PHQ40_03540 [Anaerolineaceae bacterium]|nr:hypothetical protein [Anaerolineaceae bacterium]
MSDIEVVSDLKMISQDFMERGFTIWDNPEFHASWPHIKQSGYPSIYVKPLMGNTLFKAIMTTKADAVEYPEKFLEFANRANSGSYICRFHITEDFFDPKLIANGYLLGGYDRDIFDFFLRLWEEDMKKLSHLTDRSRFLVSFESHQ